MSLAANLAIGLTGAAALSGAAVLGWLAPGDEQPPSIALARHAHPADAAPLRRPGADLADSALALASALPSSKPDAEPTVVVVRRPTRPPPPGPQVMAAPPMHDAGLVFRSQTAAVVRIPGDRLAVLLAASGGHPSRLLKVGELFDDRWRLTKLTMDEAVLGDGVTQERVPLFGNPSAGPAQPQ